MLYNDKYVEYDRYIISVISVKQTIYVIEQIVIIKVPQGIKEVYSYSVE